MEVNEFTIPAIIMLVIIVVWTMLLKLSAIWGVGLGLVGFAIVYILQQKKKK